MSTELTPEQREVVERIKRGEPMPPLTPNEIRTVVVRVRAGMQRRAAVHGGLGANAARDAHDNGLTLTHAAAAHGVAVSTVCRWYHRLYQPGRRIRRRA